MVADYTNSLPKDHRLDILSGTAKEENDCKYLDVIINIINCKEFYG